MKTSDDLFQLIHSLSKSEKRYFKLFASLYGGEKNYLRLFDAIDAQKSYDEAKLRAMFRNERFIRQLSAAKRYLREQILRSLRVYHSGGSVGAQLREMRHNIELLYDRGLIEQARAEYDAALKLATEHEEFPAMMGILAWTERLATKVFQSGDDIRAIYTPLRAAVDRYLNFIDHAEAGRYVTLPASGDYLRTQEERDAMDYAVRLLPEEMLSTRAAVVHSATMSIYHLGRREYEKALGFAERRVRLLEENPPLILSDPVMYVIAVSNLMVHHLSVGDVDEAVRWMEKVKAKAEQFLAKNMALSDRVRTRIFIAVYCMRAEIARHVGMTDTYPELITELEEGARRYSPYLPADERLKIDHTISLLHIGLGDYRRALDVNLRITQQSSPERGWWTYYHARLLHLVIHYELGNFDLLEYLVRSTYRYFRSRNIIYRFEEIVLEFFQKVLRVDGDPDVMTKLFEETRCRLSDLANDRQEQHAFVYFDYVGWLERKIAERARIMASRRPAA